MFTRCYYVILSFGVGQWHYGFPWIIPSRRGVHLRLLSVRRISGLHAVSDCCWCPAICCAATKWLRCRYVRYLSWIVSFYIACECELFALVNLKSCCCFFVYSFWIAKLCFSLDTYPMDGITWTWVAFSLTLRTWSTLVRHMDMLKQIQNQLGFFTKR